MEKPIKIEISHRTIVFTVVLLLVVWLLYSIREIILGFFISLLIMSILNPTVTKLSRYKIPRLMSVFMVYLMMLSLTGIVIALLIPPLIIQSSNFVANAPKYLDSIGVFGPYTEHVLGQIFAQIGILPGKLAKLTLSVFSNVLAVATVLVFSFYLLVYRDKLYKRLGYFLGSKREKEAVRVLDLLEKKLGGWFRARLFSMFIIWITTYLGLLILGIPYALPLSILAGLLEIVPNIGPVVAAIPAIIIGFGISSMMGVATLALAFLIQQAESYLLTPKIMEKTVGVNPIVTLLAMAIGFKLAGIVGILISIPCVVLAYALFEEYTPFVKNGNDDNIDDDDEEYIDEMIEK